MTSHVFQKHLLNNPSSPSGFKYNTNHIQIIVFT